MRDKDRLDEFYEQMCDIHKRYFPDWRFGQLVSNLTNWLWSGSADIFFLEEDQMVKRIKDFAVTYAVYGKVVKDDV